MTHSDPSRSCGQASLARSLPVPGPHTDPSVIAKRSRDRLATSWPSVGIDHTLVPAPCVASLLTSTHSEHFK
jgi:hypothetical protein